MTQIQTNLGNTRESARELRVEPTTASGGNISQTNVQKALEQISTRGFISITDPPYNASPSAADNLSAINSAMAAAAAGPRALYIPGGTFLVSGPVNIPLNMTLGRIFGDSLFSILKASTTFVGSAVMTADATLSLLTMQNFTVDASNIAPIAINLTRTPESSIQHNIDNVKILQLPTGSTGLVLDGCEDSTLNRVSISNMPGATGVKAVKWLAPAGNIWIHDSIFIGDVGGLPVYLSCQNGEIARTTHGAIVADTGGVGIINLIGTYGYADRGATKANFFVAGASTFGAINITGGYLNNNQQINVVAFQGAYSDVVKIDATYFDSTGVAGYTLFSAATTAFAGTTPSFEIDGLTLVSTAAFGTPGTGVSVSRRWFGKAGFGTLTPIYPLEVNVNQNSGTVLGVTNNNAGASAAAQVLLQSLGTQGTFSASSPASGGNFGITWDGIGAIRYAGINAAGAHEWYTGVGFTRRMALSTLGALTLDAYGLGILHSSAAGILTSSAVDLSGADAAGVLAAARFPALTGDVTTSSGSLATAVGATKITSAMLNADVFSTAHSWGGLQSFSDNLTMSAAAKTLVLKQGANGAVGTFVCNGATPVTVNNTSVAITDTIIISLNTVGGTVGAVPSVKTITAATGFTVAGTAADTSTYNYAIIKNAA